MTYYAINDVLWDSQFETSPSLKKSDGSRCMEALFFGDVWAAMLV